MPEISYKYEPKISIVYGFIKFFKHDLLNENFGFVAAIMKPVLAIRIRMDGSYSCDATIFIKPSRVPILRN